MKQSGILLRNIANVLGAHIRHIADVKGITAPVGIMEGLPLRSVRPLLTAPGLCPQPPSWMQGGVGTVQPHGAATHLHPSGLNMLRLSQFKALEFTLKILRIRTRRRVRTRTRSVRGTDPLPEAAQDPVSRFFGWPPPPRGAVPKLASSNGPRPILDV